MFCIPLFVAIFALRCAFAVNTSSSMGRHAVHLIVCLVLWPAIAGNAPHVELAEVNLVVTTDIHSWVSGHAHDPYLNATLGHVKSLVDHLRVQSQALKRDVFIFDNGDINDGTALSGFAADHVDYLGPLMHAVPYDALNIGNHELYSLTQGLFSGAECAVVGLRDSGYIASWASRYITSNVVWANTTSPVGNRHTVLEGRFGTRLLVFGFLYNMADHCSAVEVEDVATVVGSSWFQEALQLQGATFDAIVVLAHMHYEDPLIDTILAGIRQLLPSTPVQFLAGHSHMRGWRRLDADASVFEAGCKLNTVGFTSFSPSEPARATDFYYVDLDGNTAAIAAAINVTEPQLLTPSGAEVVSTIKDMRTTIGADSVIGCSSQKYDAWADLGQEDSLWSFYMGTVVPGVLFGTADGNPMLAVVGRGALIEGVFPGPVTLDDAYSTSPYGNFWLITHGIPGTVLAQLLHKLNTKELMAEGRARGTELPQREGDPIPAYVNSSAPKSGTLYDFIICDFDLYPITVHLKDLLGEVPKFDIYKRQQNTSSVLVDWFRAHEPCPLAPDLHHSPLHLNRQPELQV